MSTPAERMTAGPAPDGEPLDLAGLLARAQRESLRGFAPAQLCRFALLPRWTDDTAVRFGLVDAEDLADLHARLDRAGLVDRRSSTDPHAGAGQVFWLRLSRRDEVGRYLRELDLPIDVEITRLADAVIAALGPPAEANRRLAGELAPWLEVALELRHDHSGASLYERVDSLLAEADGLTAATRLVAAARTIGMISGGTLADAARRAGWRLDRAHRDTQDVEYLRDYQRRADVEDALAEIIGGEGPGSPWALHLLGSGGIGKTMLLRYLASGQYAAARDLPAFPVARVDFDHLDPRYPEHRPAEVLLALADELTGYGQSRAWSYAYRRFRDAAGALHEHLGRAGDDTGHEADPPEQVYGHALYPAHGPTRSAVGAIRAAAAATIQTLFTEVVRAFARVLRELGRSRVVLVLDTCEELSKLYVPGAAAPAIDRTFDLLERLHGELPDVRVVLAGRRPLTPPADEHARAAGPRLHHRDYLRVVEVTGFTAAEATSFLDAGLAAAGRVRPSSELRAALLDLARMPASTPGEARYNPFELAAYRDWIVREPDLRPEVLRDAGDPLVERRIIQRLADVDIRGALGVAVELGRFDHAMIAPALRRAGLDPRAAFDGLAAQEWIQVVALRADGRPSLLEIGEPLRDRIRAVLAADPAAYPLDRTALGRDAAALVAADPLGQVRAEAVVAAVQLLPPEEAAAFWSDLEARIVATGEWAWAAQITARAAAAERLRADARPDTAVTIMAAILATQAAARIHTGHRAETLPLWNAVFDHASRHPNPDDRGSLAARALLGRISAEVGRVSIGSLPVGSASAGIVRGEIVQASSVPGVPAGSVLGALEAVMSQQAPDDKPSVFTRAAVEWAVDLDWLLKDGDPTVRLAAELASAVLRLRAGTSPQWETVPRLLAAVDAVERAGPDTGSGWADWAAPRGLVDRAHAVVLLTRAAATRPAAAPDLTGGWLDGVLARIDDIDAERHAATALRQALGRRVVPRDVVSRFDRHTAYVAGRRPAVWSHRQTRSLTAEVADAWAMLDEPHRAAFILTVYREDARVAGDDPQAVEECDLALLDLCRRYRTTEFSPSIRQLARDGPPRVRAEAWFVLSLIEGARPATPAEAGSWHGWWRCQDYHSLAGDDAARWPPLPPLAAEPAWPASTDDVDRAEWRRLNGLPVVTDAGDGPGERLEDRHLRLHWAALRAAARADGGGVDGGGAEGGGADAVAAVLAGLPPLAGARAAVRVAEELGSRLPRDALALFGRPVGRTTPVEAALASAGDAFGAAAALVLRVLLRARAGSPVEVVSTMRELQRITAWPGWRERAQVAGLATVPRPNPAPPGSAGELSEDVVPPPPWILGPTGRNGHLSAWEQLGLGATAAGQAGGPTGEPSARTAPDPSEPDLMSARPTGLRRGTRLGSHGWPVRASVEGLRRTARVASRVVLSVLALALLLLVPDGGSQPAARVVCGLAGSAAALAVAVPVVARWAAARHHGAFPPQLLRPLPPRRFGPYRVRRGESLSAYRGQVTRTPELGQFQPYPHVLPFPVGVILEVIQPLVDHLREAGRRMLFGSGVGWNLRNGRINARRAVVRIREPARQLRLALMFVAEQDRMVDWERRLAAVLPAQTARGIVFVRGGPPPYVGLPSESEPMRIDSAGVFHGPQHLRPMDTAGGPVPVPGFMHVVGTPVRTSSGLRLRVGDSGLEPGGTDNGLLLGIEDLDVRDVVLTVLQADPVDGGARSLGEDRAGFVDLAIATLDAGSHAVLVIPPLPDTIAAAAAEAVRAAVRAVRPDERGGARSVDVLPIIAAREAKEAIYLGLSASLDEPGAFAVPSGPPRTSSGAEAAASDPRAGDDVLLFVR